MHISYRNQFIKKSNSFSKNHLVFPTRLAKVLIMLSSLPSDTINRGDPRILTTGMSCPRYRCQKWQGICLEFALKLRRSKVDRMKPVATEEDTSIMVQACLWLFHYVRVVLARLARTAGLFGRSISSQWTIGITMAGYRYRTKSIIFRPARDLMKWWA